MSSYSRKAPYQKDLSAKSTGDGWISNLLYSTSISEQKKAFSQFYLWKSKSCGYNYIS